MGQDPKAVGRTAARARLYGAAACSVITLAIEAFVFSEAGGGQCN
jgi:hypothetical protein